jgi:hypothetical protein
MEVYKELTKQTQHQLKAKCWTINEYPFDRRPKPVEVARVFKYEYLGTRVCSAILQTLDGDRVLLLVMSELKNYKG